MSSYNDEHLIISCSNRKSIGDFRNIIIDLIKKEFQSEGDTMPDYGNYVSPVLASLMGGAMYGVYFIFIPADCSKEGWGVSNVMDEVREKIRSKAVYQNAKNTDSNKKISIIKVTDGNNSLSAEYELKGVIDK